jgi:ABC-type antimicrobial peptide transport system permease subunit
MIGEGDTETAPFVVVVNETFARKYFPGQDAIGKQISLGGKDTGMLKPYTIAGVLGDQAGNSVSAARNSVLLLPYQQIPASSLFYAALLKTVVSFVVKTGADIPVAPAARAAFQQVAPDFALDNFQTMQEGFTKSNFNQRLGLYLVGAFGAMAVLMVIAGLYGVLAQMVGYRRREIGVRLALGATPPGILSMILRQASLLVLGGIAGGIALSAAATQLEQDFLFGVKPLDVWTYAAVTVLLLMVGALAAFVPARRAAAVEPVEALREQ